MGNPCRNSNSTRKAPGNFAGAFVASNGKIIADSGESYKNKADCQKGIDLIKAEASAAQVEEK